MIMHDKCKIIRWLWQNYNGNKIENSDGVDAKSWGGVRIRGG